jgi:hypothetical protein
MVKLKLYDILGCEIQTLMNEQENSGIKAFPFDAANLSNGMYFFCIKTGNIMQTKIMVIQ